MEGDLYDEFGNYIGPELSESEVSGGGGLQRWQRGGQEQRKQAHF